MKAKILDKWGYQANAHEMRRLLGVQRLPIEGMPERTINGVRVYVKPQAPTIPPGQRKRHSHRIIIICTCGQHVPSGRIHQHSCVKKGDKFGL